MLNNGIKVMCYVGSKITFNTQKCKVDCPNNTKEKPVSLFRRQSWGFGVVKCHYCAISGFLELLHWSTFVCAYISYMYDIPTTNFALFWYLSSYTFLSLLKGKLLKIIYSGPQTGNDSNVFMRSAVRGQRGTGPGTEMSLYRSY